MQILIKCLANLRTETGSEGWVMTTAERGHEKVIPLKIAHAYFHNLIAVFRLTAIGTLKG